MEKFKIGFGIVVYDKFEEAKILCDIIKGFDDKFYTLVCSNHPDGKKYLEYENIDKVIISENIPFEKSKWSSDRHNFNLIMRVTNNIQRCNQELIKNVELDYCVFLHSDSWTLDKEKLLSLINDLHRNNQYFATTGVGFKMMSRYTPLGNILDFFWVYKRKEIENSKLFEFDVVEMLPHNMDSHGIFAANLVIKVGLGKILYYFNNAHGYFYKNQYLTESNTKFMYNNNANPALIIPEFGFVHVHVGAFPNGLGEELQAYYLRNFNLKKGKAIENFLSKHNMSDKNIFFEIKKLDKSIKRKLFFHGLNYNLLGLGKNYNLVLNYINNTGIFNKMKNTLVCWIRFIIIKTLTREKYYDLFYGAKIQDGLGEYYYKNLYGKEELNKLGHSNWYENYKRLKL